MHKNNHHTRHKMVLLVVLGLLSTTMLLGSAAADPTTENVTKLKEGIVETLATWIPFVILFVLIGLALSALGINLFRSRL